jgi:sugar (pentulose or hexulose) kinase
LACGTAWVFTGVVTSADVTRLPDTLDLNFHIPTQHWTVSQSLGGLGASLEWWVNQAWIGERHKRFSTLDAELSKIQPHPKLFFSPLTGGHDNPATTRSGGFTGLQLAHQRADMAYAILESAGFELQWALEALKKVEMPIEQLWMVGGAANSSHWPSILANITGITIQLPGYNNWPALGAALLAGVGIGLFDDIETGLHHFNKPIIEINPNENLMVMYEEKFSDYKTACTQLRQIPFGN